MSDDSFPGPAVLALARGPALRRRRVGWLAGVAVLLALAGWLASHQLASPPAPPAVVPAQEPPAALTVRLAAATERLFARPIIGDGSVVAWQDMSIGIEVAGLRVVEVPIEEGDRVAQGQLLARLDDALPASQAAQAEAAVTEAEAVLTLAQADLRRSTELARSESVARQTLEQRQSMVRQLEAKLLASRARRDEATARLAQTRILAPDAGIVARRSILPGAVAQPGQEVARLIRDGRLELDARVPELDLAAVRPGQPVRVRHGATEIEARVRAVAPIIANDNRLGIVHIALPAGSGLQLGMFAQAEIFPAATAALTVPQEAVVYREGRPAVFVLPDSTARVALRAVRTGGRRDGVVEVTEGLAAGERVVAGGAGFLSDGDRVHVARDR
ncbi:efflux RND transporter periplasmic adaptor subunit [Belnapia moabensis]|uniref:efflux RND transporter periplasmic adaptor subunit n=1 Tax=Belnapia moabensis TaxID=365533 RepID=UPI000694FFE0|nr:efflux RND transporter periplasmic adaptor subunit [Belnapia moabensis]